MTSSAGTNKYEPCEHVNSHAQAQDRFRVNLFKVFSPLQRFARSSLWPDDLNFRLTAYIYPAYVLLLLLGPQERSTNFGLNLFWCYWWPVIFLVYPFLGRIWCSGKQLTALLQKVSHILPTVISQGCYMFQKSASLIDYRAFVADHRMLYPCGMIQETCRHTQADLTCFRIILCPSGPCQLQWAYGEPRQRSMAL